MAFQEITSANAVLSAEITATRNALTKIGAFFRGLGESMSKASSARRRFEVVQMLQAKSDAELAQLGIKRDQIVKEVFNDLYYS